MAVLLISFIGYKIFIADNRVYVADEKPYEIEVEEPTKGAKNEETGIIGGKVSSHLMKQDDLKIPTSDNTNEKIEREASVSKDEIVIKRVQIKKQKSSQKQHYLKAENDEVVAKKGFSGSGENTFNRPPKEVNLKEGSLEEALNRADIVFVGYIENQLKTEYEEKLNIETDDGQQQQIATPMSNFKIRVIDSLKGNIEENKLINLKKYGGLNEDGKSQFILKDDILPTKGMYYIFIATLLDENHLYAEGPLSNKEIQMDSKGSLINSAVYLEYKAALKILNEKQSSTDRMVQPSSDSD